MKNQLTKALILATSIIVSHTALAENDHEIKYSTKGYPYNLLIERARSLKISYIEKQQNVNCKVIFNHNGETLISEKVSTATNDFELTPLASCLNRQQAKQWLAKTF